jgi:hypothetical protein
LANPVIPCIHHIDNSGRSHGDFLRCIKLGCGPNAIRKSLCPAGQSGYFRNTRLVEGNPIRRWRKRICYGRCHIYEESLFSVLETLLS